MSGNIGSIAETHEVLDFCAEHEITADVQVIPIERINEAFDRVVAKEARFRFVVVKHSLAGLGVTGAPLP